MATVSELEVKNRAEKLAEAIVRNVPRLPHCYDELTEELGVSEASVQYECDLAKLIEQALLAERRLAKLEDAEMVSGRVDPDCICDSCDTCLDIAKQVRAAAEKEVSNGD